MAALYSDVTGSTAYSVTTASNVIYIASDYGTTDRFDHDFGAAEELARDDKPDREPPSAGPEWATPPREVAKVIFRLTLEVRCRSPP